jgi:hypothetical protein
VDDSALFDQAIANLRELGGEMRSAGIDAAGLVHAQAVQCWTDAVDEVIADLLKIERRARYAEALAAGAALVDVIAHGPPA